MKNKILLFLALGAMLLTGCNGGSKDSTKSGSEGGGIKPSSIPSEVESESESESESSEAEQKISEVNITGVQVPVAGQNVAPLNSVSIGVDGPRFSDYNCYWCVQNEYNQFYFFARFFENDKVFEGGKIYQVRFLLEYDEGFAENVTATVNGYSAEVELKSQGDELVVEYVFQETAVETMNTINITGVTAPVADETPSLEGITANLTGNERYVIAQKVWVLDIEDEPHNFFYTTSSDELKFHGGDKYGIKIAVQKNGSLDFADDVKAYINENEATILSNENGIVTFVYYFDTLEGKAQVHKFDITGITPPAVNQAATLDGLAVTHDDLIFVNSPSNTFWCYYTSETSTYFFSRGQGEKFESGKKYCLKIMISLLSRNTTAFADDDHIFLVTVDKGTIVNIDRADSGDYVRITVDFPSL